MIKLVHSLAKGFIILWGILGIISCGMILIGIIGSSHSSTDAGGMGMIAVMGFGMVGVIWFFPTMAAIIVAYFTRPQAWETKASPPVALPE